MANLFEKVRANVVTTINRTKAITSDNPYPIIFNSDVNKHQGYQGGGVWVDLSSSGEDLNIIAWHFTNDVNEAINVAVASFVDFYVATTDLLSSDARWSLGASALHPFSTLNQTYTDTGGTAPTTSGGRVDPYIHSINPNVEGVTTIEVGIVHNLGPVIGICEFAIWELNSQSIYYKVAHLQIKVVNIPV